MRLTQPAEIAASPTPMAGRPDPLKVLLLRRAPSAKDRSPMPVRVRRREPNWRDIVEERLGLIGVQLTSRYDSSASTPCTANARRGQTSPHLARLRVAGRVKTLEDAIRSATKSKPGHERPGRRRARRSRRGACWRLPDASARSASWRVDSEAVVTLRDSRTPGRRQATCQHPRHAYDIRDYLGWRLVARAGEGAICRCRRRRRDPP